MMPSVAQSTIQVIPVSELQERPIRIGSTTELAIFPPGSNFDARNFMARVSTATLTQGGEFTKFGGYNRILALVSGEGMDLTISGNTRAITEPFEPVRFSGEAPADSTLRGGAIRDFNVIFRPEVDANLQHVVLSSVFSALDIRSFGGMGDNATRVDVLWSPDANLEIEAGRRTLTIGAGDVFVLQHGRSETLVHARAVQGSANLLFVNLRIPKG